MQDALMRVTEEAAEWAAELETRIFDRIRLNYDTAGICWNADYNFERAETNSGSVDACTQRLLARAEREMLAYLEDLAKKNPEALCWGGAEPESETIFPSGGVCIKFTPEVFLSRAHKKDSMYEEDKNLPSYYGIGASVSLRIAGYPSVATGG